MGGGPLAAAATLALSNLGRGLATLALLRALIQGATLPGARGRVAPLLVAPFLEATLAAAASVGAPLVAGGARMVGVTAGALVMGRREAAATRGLT